MHKLCFLSILLLTLLAMPLVSYAHCKGNHSEYAPHCGGDDPSPPESCAEAPGDFPAFAFARTVTGTRKGGTWWTGNDIYLADSTGTCELRIFSLDFRSATNLNFRLNGNRGRIVWMQSSLENLKRNDPATGPVLKLLEFTVNAGEISNITHRVAWKKGDLDAPYDSVGSALSPDGNTAYFTFGDHSQLSSGGEPITTVRWVDLTSCNTDCPDNFFASTTSIFPYWDLAVNDDASRVYFVQLQGGVGFIDTATENIRYIMKREDFPVTVAFQDISMGYLSSGNEAIAVGYDKDRGGTLDIVDVGSCALDGTPITGPTCLASKFSSFGKTVIPGGKSTFDGPDLLVAGDGAIYLHSVEDAMTPAEVFIVDGHAPDSAH